MCHRPSGGAEMFHVWLTAAVQSLQQPQQPPHWEHHHDLRAREENEVVAVRERWVHVYVKQRGVDPKCWQCFGFFLQDVCSFVCPINHRMKHKKKKTWFIKHPETSDLDYSIQAKSRSQEKCFHIPLLPKNMRFKLIYNWYTTNTKASCYLCRILRGTRSTWSVKATWPSQTTEVTKLPMKLCNITPLSLNYDTAAV